MRSIFANIGKLKAAGLAVAGVAAVTLVLLPFRPYLNATEVALTLLLVVLLAATLFGSRAGLSSAIVGILVFNFFFLPPFYTFSISGPEDWVAFGAFILTALVAGQLSGYARRRAEESERHQRKIERLYEELKQAVDQVSEAEAIRKSEKLKTALLDAVTHDLRTPLTSIKASVTTLLDDAKRINLDVDSRREFLQIIDEETDRLNQFIEGMVSIAKVEAGAVETSKGAASIEEIVGNAVERARVSLEGHRLEIDLAPDTPMLDVDAASVSQAVFSLLDNAAKYSPPDSIVRISTRVTAGGKLRVIVEDQGDGIPRLDRDRVFEKFTRLETSEAVASAGGLGLGLAIARGIMESQGGRIWIEDGSREFATRIVCELPVSSGSAETKAATTG